MIRKTSGRKGSRICGAVDKAVAQVSNLLYRRFPIGRRSENVGPPKQLQGQLLARTEPMAGWKPATQQTGNLRYVVPGFAAMAC
jgi:hypothetical protein